MKQMSEYVSKLEGYAELEVSIIRATKINKVLKAILKLASIPKEEEFHFKPRSQSLLDKWNKLLASEQGTPSASAPPTNGTSETKAEVAETKASPVASTNGTQEVVAEAKVEEATDQDAEEMAEGDATPIKSSGTGTKDALLAVETTTGPLADGDEPSKVGRSDRFWKCDSDDT